MTDTVIASIESGELTSENISFGMLRQLAGRDCGVWDQLGRGRAILGSAEQLDQYLYSYGLMTRSQWAAVLEPLTLTPEPTQIIDYGCGQGLAIALLFDHFGTDLIDSINRVVLVEPSKTALRRAAAVVQCYSNELEVISINKRLEELTAEELTSEAEVLIIHVFSNVLDIDGFDHMGLFTKMFRTKGEHCVLAVSHDRDFHGGSARFRELEKEVENPEYNEWFQLRHTSVRQFDCDNGQPAIAWLLQVEVLSGPL